MLLFKNHKTMNLIYHRNQGDNFLFFFPPLVKSKQNGFALFLAISFGILLT